MIVWREKQDLLVRSTGNRAAATLDRHGGKDRPQVVAGRVSLDSVEVLMTHQREKKKNLLSPPAAKIRS